MSRAALLGAAALALAGAAQAQSFDQAERDSANWRALAPEDGLVIDTTKGRIIVELAPDLAPKHVAQIKALARAGIYNDRAFFRVWDRFMAQGGDPQDTGEGESSLPDLPAEFDFRRPAGDGFTQVMERGAQLFGFIRSLPVTSQPEFIRERAADKRLSAWAMHCPGVTSMARDDDPGSANSQYFIMRAPYLSLDRRYSIWGRAVVGADVAVKFATGEPVPQPDRTTTVRVLADIAPAERPRVLIQRTDGPVFQRAVKAQMRRMGASFTLCDVTIPALVK
jgi:peptidylprolyl isomerase